MKTTSGLMYQARLSSRFGRKTIGLGSNELQALNVALVIDEHIIKQLAIGDEIDLDELKSITRTELDRYKQKKQPTIKVVEKDDLSVLWSKYVEYHTTLKLWSDTTIKTAVQTCTSIIQNCPYQKLEQRQDLFLWVFSDDKRSQATSKTRLKWIVACIDWNSKQGNIPRKWGIEYRDAFSGLKLKDTKVDNKFTDDTDISIFTVDEIYLILSAFKNGSYETQRGTHSQYYEYVYFLWLTGCRPSEATALKWKHVNLQKNHIKFCENRVNASGKIIESAGTKTEDSRLFPINAELHALLTNVKTRKDYVFLNRRYEPISQHAFCRVWKTVLEGIGLPYRIPYQLRHSMISYHANNDYPIHKLAEIVGNSEKIIKEHYLKLDIERISLPGIIR
ncbi:site-specific integrase [Cronbergia sp. UHCC 0137]|uniref:tyrosine-type recombinase/integrase n=1 Tax=Cronbergia sp. UHCC 0137 TaxID=3110239 RepID=UPI002B219C09|nr:site-specific integrase [Cronbergia sp. UHCC 0137]MEA5620519.1 site-specific integrase [Cronbergia sp. UHCC 0137]